jgi:hypothetical protein
LNIPECWSPILILSDSVWEFSVQQINANNDEKISINSNNEDRSPVVEETAEEIGKSSINIDSNNCVDNTYDVNSSSSLCSNRETVDVTVESELQIYGEYTSSDISSLKVNDKFITPDFRMHSDLSASSNDNKSYLEDEYSSLVCHINDDNVDKHDIVDEYVESNIIRTFK